MKLTKIVQEFPRPTAGEITAVVRDEIRRLGLTSLSGRIAVAVGSRGIHQLPQIISATLAGIRALGGTPFIVPAMGSHGGATADGQRQLLASYGITPEAMGCPVVSSLEVVELDCGSPGLRIFMDRQAYEADGVVVINRVKPHTSFHGRYESGLAKMLVVGLGKEKQAAEIHRFGAQGLRTLIEPAARCILNSGKIRFGVALVENAYDETARVRALRAEQFLAEEPGLLEYARTQMPRLPAERIDVLVLEEMGKNISGLGLDPNVIGRLKIHGEPEPTRPAIHAILVRDLTAESHGNAIGMGLADVISRRLFEKIDFAATYKNVVTSTFLERAKVPLVADSDAQGFAAALRSCGAVPEGRERVMRIRNTLQLSEAWVSPALLEELAGAPHIRVTGQTQELLTPEGSFFDFWQPFSPS